MRFSGKSSFFRAIGLLLAVSLLVVLAAGCALSGGESSDAVPGQVKPNGDGLSQLPKYTGYETSTPIPTIEPEEKKQQFLVATVSNYADESGATIFIGRLKNTTLMPLDYAVVTVHLLDGNGEVVASGSDYTLLDVTFPEGTNAFRVAMGSDVPEWVDYRIDVEGDRYLGDYLNPDLDFSVSTAGSSESGGFQLIGEVFNKSETIAQDVYLLILLYDQQLNLLDAGVVQTDLDVIPVRGDSPFEYLWEWGRGVEVGHYEVFLQGYR